MFFKRGKASFSGSSRRYIALAAFTLTVFALIVLAWLGPAQVWAGLQSALGLASESFPNQLETDQVPVCEPARQEEGEVSQVDYDNSPILIELEIGSIEVVGFNARPAGTCLLMIMEQVPAFRVFPGFDQNADIPAMRERLDERLRQIHLLDDTGGDYRYQGGNFSAEHFLCSGCASGTTWSTKLYLELPPLKDQVESITLVVPLSEELELRKDFPLAVLQSIGDCFGLGEAVSR